MSKRIACDFDGTITKYNSEHEMGDIQDGVRESLQMLKDMGYYISIFSCRTSPELFKHLIDRLEQKRIIESFLNKHDIPFDEILMCDKPIADFYIDDHNIEFRGSWSDTINRIKEIKNGEQ